MTERFPRGVNAGPAPCPFAAEGAGACRHFTLSQAGIGGATAPACAFSVIEESADRTRRTRCWRRTSRPSQVLIVEDEADMRHLLRLRFQFSGWFPRAVADGHKAMAELRGWIPDAIITDWHMPLMDGPTLLRAVRCYRQLDAVPVVILSGDIAAPSTAELTGASAVVSKWARWEAIRAELERVLPAPPATQEGGGAGSSPA